MKSYKESHSQWLTENPLRVDVTDVNDLTVRGEVTNGSKMYKTDHGFFTQFKTALTMKKPETI